MDLSELEIVCANCSYPAVTTYDEEGKLLSYEEAPGAPKTEEEAAKMGWYDHGVGLYCPKCSLQALQDSDESSVGFDAAEVIDRQVLKSFVADLDPRVEEAFVNIFRYDRLRKLREKLGLPKLDPMTPPAVEDDIMAEQFIAINKKLEEKRQEIA